MVISAEDKQSFRFLVAGMESVGSRQVRNLRRLVLDVQVLAYRQRRDPFVVARSGCGSGMPWMPANNIPTSHF